MVRDPKPKPRRGGRKSTKKAGPRPKFKNDSIREQLEKLGLTQPNSPDTNEEVEISKEPDPSSKASS
jgi:hypothetical protein